MAPIHIKSKSTNIFVWAFSAFKQCFISGLGSCVLLWCLSAVWALILTAPIHCRGASYVHFCKSVLMKKQTHLIHGFYSSKPLHQASTAVKLGFKEDIKDINLLVQKDKKNVLEASERQARLTVGTGREPWRFREELDAERLRAVSVSPGPGPDTHCCSWHDREEEEEEEGDAECEKA